MIIILISDILKLFTFFLFVIFKEDKKQYHQNNLFKEKTSDSIAIKYPISLHLKCCNHDCNYANINEGLLEQVGDSFLAVLTKVMPNMHTHVHTYILVLYRLPHFRSVPIFDYFKFQVADVSIRY